MSLLWAASSASFSLASSYANFEAEVSYTEGYLEFAEEVSLGERW